MLTLIIGRAGSGKTSYIFEQMAKQASLGVAGNILIVPEQYSHDAERYLASACGDSGCLYGEVLSFSRLYSRVTAEMGGAAATSMDNGGRILAMSRALSSVSANLKVYSLGSRRPEFLEKLISSYDELRSSCVDGDTFARAADLAEGNFGDKLRDLSLIFETYEAIKERSGLDQRDKLTRLADEIGESSIGVSGKIFIDGFTDFTAQEMRVIEKLIKKGADVNVCLNCPSVDDDSTAFSLASRTARALLAMASRLRTEADINHIVSKDGTRPESLKYLERRLFDYGAEPFDGISDEITVSCGENISEECAIAATRVLELVRGGARFRDIAVVSPDWDRYASVTVGTFEKYGIPVNVSVKNDILEKPVLSVLTSALDIIANNWDYNSIFRYVKTGLAGITPEESDILENYVLKWNIRGRNAWNRSEGWKMHPEGYADTFTDSDAEKIEKINALRERVASPVSSLEEAFSDAETASEKAEAVYTFLEGIELYGKLKEKEAELRTAGEHQTAEEYSQLWDILVGALCQFAEVLGDLPVSGEETARLIRLVLSQYDVGSIPATVDGVGVGDMKRMRGRGIKHLIIMGADSDSFFSREKQTGMFSFDERKALRDMGVELPDAEEDTVAREMGALYNSLTMPSCTLSVTYPASGGSGRHSFIIRRIEKLFGTKEINVGKEIYASSPKSIFELAASRDGGVLSRAAEKCFEDVPEWENAVNEIRLASKMSRGRLQKSTAEKLYGDKIRVSASKIDKYHGCRFAYFLQYGLNAKPRDEATFDALEIGSFMHFVLEHVTRDAEARGGFKNVSDEELSKMTQTYASRYAAETLGGLEGKTGRFKYLFGRTVRDAVSIVQNMAEELRNSDFKPMDFELKFAADGALPPVSVEGETGQISINGAVDRVDGWVKDGKLYLRVVDYKTGKKKFSLSDIWYGIGLQMLIYLFALEKEGEGRYDRKIVPAGVLYAPARDLITSAQYDLTDEELSKKRMDEIKRSGLILDDPDVIEAMEHGKVDGYLPVKFKKDGTPSGDSLASLEMLGALSRHIDEIIRSMGDELRRGTITADPYFVSQQDSACTYCEYFDVCHFDPGSGNGDKARYLSKLKPAEVWSRMEGHNDE